MGLARLVFLLACLLAKGLAVDYCELGEHAIFPFFRSFCPDRVEKLYLVLREPHSRGRDCISLSAGTIAHAVSDEKDQRSQGCQQVLGCDHAKCWLG
ncbi:hypothetical protein BCV70DRAFT_103290 [Testicularia cyperi]|uniref:Uncharacterized protein n=1 Tax=Testicularia cyperi TaxID=1882483 RepID=A0A317XRJ1_9BASI|nr:hypothetical protein BCV70DRAFT_103290 [Testicularia cyperi]